MQIFSRGAQFEVAADDNYVYKRLHSIKKSAAVYRSWGYGFKTRDLDRLAKKTLEKATASLKHINAILKNHPELAPSLANPIIANDLRSYKQDKVIPMGAALRSSSASEAKTLINQYVDLCLWHAKYGFAELVFNIGVNYGVDSNSKVVLIDLGELTFDKNKVIAAVAGKKWGKAQNYLSPIPYPRKATIPMSLRPYYRRQMLNRLTPEAIENKWLTIK
jgi:hypothetical protein